MLGSPGGLNDPDGATREDWQPFGRRVVKKSVANDSGTLSLHFFEP